MKLRTTGLVLLTMLALAGIAQACPMCKDSIPATDAQNFQAMPSAYNWSVYFYLLGLFGVMGFVGFTLVKAARTTTHRASQVTQANKAHG